MPHFFIGVETEALSDRDIARLSHPYVVGVILFCRNFTSSDQLKALTHQIKQLRSDLIISVDHEGGRVQRFHCDKFTKLDAPFTLNNRSRQVIEEHALILAADLKAHGVDISFTPVVDLYHPNSRIIANRAFSSDPDEVTRIAEIYIQALHHANMPSVLKHFPGHGMIEADTHLEAAENDNDLEALQLSELKPFVALIAKGLADSVMVGHVRYPSVDKQIASMSYFWLSTYLRKTLNFQGIIFSDDLGMFAAQSANKNSFNRVWQFFNAGGDVALLCNNFSVIDQVLMQYRTEDVDNSSFFNKRWQKFIMILNEIYAPILRKDLPL